MRKTFCSAAACGRGAKGSWGNLMRCKIALKNQNGPFFLPCWALTVYREARIWVFLVFSASCQAMCLYCLEMWGNLRYGATVVGYFALDLQMYGAKSVR